MRCTPILVPIGYERLIVFEQRAFELFAFRFGLVLCQILLVLCCGQVDEPKEAFDEMFFQIVMNGCMHLRRKVRNVESEVTKIVFFVMIKNGPEVVGVECIQL